MANSVKLLNYVDTDGEYIKFYTELESDFKVGDKVFIVGGNFDNTIYTNTTNTEYNIFHEYASGYEVISVDSTALSNAVTLNIKFNNSSFTSGGVVSYIFDPKPVYKTEEEIASNPNQIREAYISKSYFKHGEFNGGKFQDGIFGEYNIVDEKLSLSDTKFDKSIFNNNIKNTPAQWLGGIFLGGEFQWGEIKSKYNSNKSGKIQKLNDRLGIRDILDNNKYDIKSFYDNNNGIGYSQFVSGNFGNTTISGDFWNTDSTTHTVHLKAGRILSANWYNGVFENGVFDGGNWYNGKFISGRIRSNYQITKWLGGEFGVETEQNTIAEDLRWYNGTWNNGTWRGASVVGIEHIYYTENTINIEIKSNKKQLFVTGEPVFISYIKNSLTNQYLDNFTDIPNQSLLNFQSFKLIEILENEINKKEYRVTLILDGTTNINLNNISLQNAKVSQSVFSNGTWKNGIWESGLRKTVDAKWLGGVFKSGVWDGGTLEETWECSYVDSIIDDKEVIGKEIISTNILKTYIESGFTSKGKKLLDFNKKIPSVFTNSLYFDTQNKQIQSIWKSGTFINGTWENGIFLSGLWKNGTWMSGTMTNLDNETIWENGTWRSGTFKRGIFKNGTMINGTIINGTIDKIDWKEGVYTNGYNLYDNTINNNRSGRFISEKNEYDSISAPSIVYIDSKGWVQLDQPSFYQKGYSVIFQDLDFHGENSYNNEMFTVQDTKDYGTKVKIDAGENPILPIISIGDVVGISALSETELIIGDSIHNRLIEVDYQKGLVDVYGKVVGGSNNLNINFKNIKALYANPYKTVATALGTNSSTNIYVVDDNEVKIITVDKYIKKGSEEVIKTTNLFKVKPLLEIAEEILDIWVAPSLISVSEAMFVITNLGNIHYWSSEIGVGKIDIKTNKPYVIKNFSGARSTSGKTHFILNGTNSDNKSELRHLILDYSNANKKYEIGTIASSTNLNSFVGDNTIATLKNIKRVSIRLDSNLIKIFILDNTLGDTHEVYSMNYRKHFTNVANESMTKIGTYSDGMSYINYNSVTGFLNTVTKIKNFNVGVGQLNISDTGNILNNIILKGYKVSSANRELSPYLTSRILHNTKINKKVSFNKNGSKYSAHVISTNWDNGLFVGSWNTSKYKNHNVISQKSVFVNGIFEGVFHDGYFLGGTFRNKSINDISIFKKGHIISDSNVVKWESGNVISDTRYDIDAINYSNGNLNLSISYYKSVNGSVEKALTTGDLIKGAILQAPSVFRSVELDIYSINRGDVANDEIEIVVELPEVFKDFIVRNGQDKLLTMWDKGNKDINESIFISTTEHTQYLFGEHRVLKCYIKAEHLHFTIESKFNAFVNGKYKFISKPKLLLSKFLKVKSSSITTNTTNIIFDLPVPNFNNDSEKISFIKKVYLLDNIDILSNGSLIYPKYSQVFKTSINKTFNSVNAKFNRILSNIFVDNVIDDSLVSVDLGVGSYQLANNLTVRNSYITSTNTSDWIENSIFISGKTDRKWINGAWLNLDARGLANGKSIFSGKDTLSFEGAPMKITGCEIKYHTNGFFGMYIKISDNDFLSMIVGTSNIKNQYISLRGFTGEIANIIGSAKSCVFRIEDVLVNTKQIVIRNPLQSIAGYIGNINTTIDLSNKIEREEVYLKETYNTPFVGVENPSYTSYLDNAYASLSCWNGGDFHGNFKSVWNAGNFMNGNFDSSAKWFGSYETDYWFGSCSVKSIDNGTHYELNIDVKNTSLKGGDLVFVKFIPIYSDGEFIAMCDDFYAIVESDMTISNKSNADFNGNDDIYDIQILKYRSDYKGANTTLLDYVYKPNHYKHSLVGTTMTAPTKNSIPRVSFFYNGIFKNAVWNTGVFVGGELLPNTNTKTIWVNGIKHDGHIGGSIPVSIDRYIHWLGGFHETNSNSVSTIKNMIWYRGNWNGGTWLSGHWHSLTSTVLYDSTWSVWERGEFYSKGRYIVVKVALQNIPVSDLKMGYKTGNVTLNVDDVVFIYNRNDSSQIDKGLYIITPTGYINYVNNAEVADSTKYSTIYVSEGSNATNIYSYDTCELINSLVDRPVYSESVWHGGIWKSAPHSNKDYTYESDAFKIYTLKGNVTVEYPAVNSIWLGGTWLRGEWFGGIFANGYWHSTLSTTQTSQTPIYENNVGYVYSSNASKWYGGKMVNSIWNGGIVMDMGDALETVFGDITNFEDLGSDLGSDFGGNLATFKFKKNDSFTETILGKKVFNKNNYSEDKSKDRVFNQNITNGILPVYWRRGVWGNGLMQFSYWKNLNLNNTESSIIASDETFANNPSIFRRGLMYASYWSGGLMYASASVNTLPTSKTLDGKSPQTIFYKSQWEKGYWKANSEIKPSGVGNEAISDALFTKSIWNAGVFEGGIFDLSLWRSGTNIAGIRMQYGANDVILTQHIISAKANPLFAVSVANNVDTMANKLEVVQQSNLFTKLINMRYVGGVDNFASVWVNGTMRGSVWQGGIWQKGVFRHKEYVGTAAITKENEHNYFDTANSNKESLGVWTRGIWLSGYFSYFNDVKVSENNINNAYFDKANGQRCLFMGINATEIDTAKYDNTSIFGVSATELNATYSNVLGTATDTLHNRASMFCRKLEASTGKRFFSIFNGTFTNGTFLDDTSVITKDIKIIISPYAVVGNYGYNFAAKAIGTIDTVPYLATTLDSDVSKTVALNNASVFNTPFKSNTIMYIDNNAIVNNNITTFLNKAFNGNFHSTSTLNTGIWRHNHSVVGDGVAVSVGNKSIRQGSALKYHGNDLEQGGEPNYLEIPNINEPKQ